MEQQLTRSDLTTIIRALAELEERLTFEEDIKSARATRTKIICFQAILGNPSEGGWMTVTIK